MKLRVTLPAERELVEVKTYLLARGPQATQRVEAALQEALSLIATYPHVGHELRDGVRCLTLPRYPYLIFCRIDEAAQAVDVPAARHAARQVEH